MAIVSVISHKLDLRCCINQIQQTAVLTFNGFYPKCPDVEHDVIKKSQHLFMSDKRSTHVNNECHSVQRNKRILLEMGLPGLQG